MEITKSMNYFLISINYIYQSLINIYNFTFILGLMIIMAAFNGHSAVVDSSKETTHVSNVDQNHSSHTLDLSDITDDHGYEVEVEDHFEPFNRAIFSFNDFIDALILKPIAQTYGTLVPKWGRDRIRSFLANLHEPVYFINHLLQGEPDKAISNLGRFVTNSTAGLFGIMDIANELEISSQPTDFGLTLKKAGVGTGSYLVLPIIGPSSLRDAPSLIVDVLMDPWGYYKFKNFDRHQRIYNTATITRYSVELIDKREQNIKVLNDIENTSLDKYSTIRSIYLQKR